MKIRLTLELLLLFTMWTMSPGQSQTGPVDPQTMPAVSVSGVPGDGPVTVIGGPGFQFVSGAPIPARVVKGAPYSLEASIETTQTLGDGNRISHHSVVRMYRDSEGRTRREETFANIGPWAAAGPPATLVTIQDPLTGVDYLLDSEHKIATRVPSAPMPTLKPFRSERGSHSTNQNGDPGPVTMTAPVPAVRPGNDGGEVVGAVAFSTMPPGPGAGGGYVINQTYVGRESRMVNAAPSIVNSSEGKPIALNGKSQSLGKETIAGVSAEGTRTSTEIAAGAIGNERPIEVVNERWFSPELQIVLRTKQNDPRLGNTEYNVTKLERAEPSHVLFEIPDEYQFRDGGMLETGPK